MRRSAWPAIVAAVCLAPACYQEPQPACGFFCGPSGACPPSYSCAADSVCHLNGTSPTLVCPTPDALPSDAFVDPMPPMVTHEVPFDGETGVPVNIVPTATFNELVQDVSSSSVEIVTASAAPISLTVTYESAATPTLVMIAPTMQLPPNVTLTVALSQAIVDSYGTPLPITDWSFTTGADTVPPNVTSTTPTGGTTDVPPDTAIVVSFDELVQNVDATSFTVASSGTPIAGSITSIDPEDWVFTPSVALPAASQIDVTLTSTITDAYGNALAIYSFSFTTQ